jgi:hypothetical protein
MIDLNAYTPQTISLDPAEIREIQDLKDVDLGSYTPIKPVIKYLKHELHYRNSQNIPLNAAILVKDFPKPLRQVRNLALAHCPNRQFFEREMRLAVLILAHRAQILAKPTNASAEWEYILANDLQKLACVTWNAPKKLWQAVVYIPSSERKRVNTLHSLLHSEPAQHPRRLISAGTFRTYNAAVGRACEVMHMYGLPINGKHPLPQEHYIRFPAEIYDPSQPLPRAADTLPWVDWSNKDSNNSYDWKFYDRPSLPPSDL